MFCVYDMQGLQPDAMPISENFTNYSRDNTVVSEYRNIKYLMKYEHFYKIMINYAYAGVIKMPFA